MEGTLLFSHLVASIALVQVALHIIWIYDLGLHSICFKKCTHAMSKGYFLWYIAFYSWPCIIALVPTCSLYGYLAATITFLYPLATKLFIAYAYWHQSCLLFMPLAPKTLFQSLYPGLSKGKHQLYQNQFLHWIYTISWWFLNKTGDLSESSPVYHLVNDYFNFKYILL